MSIIFDEARKVFKLDTPNTSYLIAIVDNDQFVGHVYYGKKVEETELLHRLRIHENPLVPSKNERERCSFMDCFPFEYPTHGVGDYREDCFSVKTSAGNSAVSLSYESHNIFKGKKKLEGLPATFGDDTDCTTLELNCRDRVLDLEIILSYTVFEKLDVITRSVKVVNASETPIHLEKIYSASLDLELNDSTEYELLDMHGSWARERHMQRRTIGYGYQGLSSHRGKSGHQDHPFIACVSKNADQDNGEIYAMHFVYSGNFKAGIYKNQFDLMRMYMGINEEDFSWKLEKGESFQAPEVVMTYSDCGFSKMTHTLHDLYRNHLIRSPYKDKKRPILINNWEATYFDFDTDKLISIAKEASKLGIEMLVMDDGWFGKRNADDCALGDWFVNEKKLPGGLKYLVDEVNKLGMKFGIWFEPEMISPDSDLYRAHPDWAIAVNGRTAALSRNQYVLDLSRKEVRDCVYEQVSKILHSANIEYVKWDMNRELTDMGSAALPADRQGELFHRYTLGMYELQERLLQEFPDLLLENCSGGGARFDPGMLYFSPQIWCSDDTDAIERLSIQESTALIYPLSSMGAHVSDCPNHTVGRVTPFTTRGHVALAGTFGYELDVTKIPQEDRDLIPSQVEMYHTYNDLVRNGDYYRVASYQDNGIYDCYGVVSKDKKEALYTFVQVLNRANYHSRRVFLKGLAPDKKYAFKVGEGDSEISYKLLGSTIMNAGIQIPNPWGDYKSMLISMKEVED